MKKRINIGELYEEEYLMHNDEEDDEVYLLKDALKYALNPVERKIFITYLELETYAATAKTFRVSIPTVSKYINGLKERIIEYVDNNIAAVTDKSDNDPDTRERIHS